MKDTLVIIPARAGSKGIPQKNLRHLNGRPLIHYAIRNALSLLNADVYVSTDSQAIAQVAQVLGAQVLLRERYADDADTLDQVMRYELDRLAEKGRAYETLITLLPTSPLLRAETLQAALEHFQTKGLSSLVSCRPVRDLNWLDDGEGFKPLYQERIRREELSPLYRENGAFVICTPQQMVQGGSRIGGRLELYSVSENESVGIETQNDWILAENVLRRRRIAVVTNGGVQMGMGHIYRSLTLSARLSNDQVLFYSQRENRLGIDKLRSLLDSLREQGVQMVINDTLDTDEDYMRRLKQAGLFVVNFEDTGPGANHADIVFNALYEWSSSVADNYYGYRYEVLREDIYLYPVRQAAATGLRRLLLGFGGTDPNNATLKVLQALADCPCEGVEITVVLGVGYQYEAELNAWLAENDGGQIRIVKDVHSMADYLYQADLVISGNGRMVYETVALGVPLMVISQNEREMAHIFPKVCKGVTYLGYIGNLDATLMQSELLMFQQGQRNPQLDAELREKAHEIRQGAKRVINIINQKYDDAV